MCFNVPASCNRLCSILKPITSTVKSGNSLKASSVLAVILMSCMLIFLGWSVFARIKDFCVQGPREGALCAATYGDCHSKERLVSW